MTKVTKLPWFPADSDQPSDPLSLTRVFDVDMKKLSDFHTLQDSANGRVTDSKTLCPFVSVYMRFLSVPHAENALRQFSARPYPLASFEHVQNFERAPSDKNALWMNVTYAVCPVLVSEDSCRCLMCIRSELWNGQLQDM